MSWPNNLGKVKLITLSPDQTRIATVDINNVGKIWDLSKNNQGEFNTDKKEVLSISFSPDGKLIATGGKDGYVKLWNLSSGGMQLPQFKAHQDGVGIVNFSPDKDKQHIATVAENGDARILGISKEGISPIAELNDKDSVASIAFSSDSKLIVTGTTEGSVKLWDSLGNFKKVLANTDWGSIKTLIFSRDGKRIAALGTNGQAGVWEFSREQILKEIAKIDGVKILKMSEQQNNEIIATVGNDNKVKLWDMRGRQFNEFESKDSGNITAISFTPDGNSMAAAFDTGIVQFWQIQGLKELSDRGCKWLEDYRNTHPKETNICS
ncbi:hypothetical protein LAY57_34510 [Argonema antarcticum A004/B2]|nr:hypothetical protein [Argonema antarcticum A004/B2]